MKKIILYIVLNIFLISVYSCGETTIIYGEEKEYIEVKGRGKNEITYYKGRPFTGTILKLSSKRGKEGEVFSNEKYKEGKRHGEWVINNLDYGGKMILQYEEGKIIDKKDTYYSNPVYK